jgi:mannosylglycoprotein endo-beta-mannosidase
VQLSIANSTEVISFFNRIRVLDPATGALIEPVFATDGYFSVLPGASASVRSDFRFAGASDPTVTVQGWNARPVAGASDRAVAVRWRGP